MTTVLDRVEPDPAPPFPAQRPTRLSRWWSSWRVAVRLARRDAWHGKGRALLVLLLVALPVATVVAVIVSGMAQSAVQSSTNQALLSLGSVADARIMLVTAPAEQSVDTTTGGMGNGPAVTRNELLATLPPGTTLVDAGGSAPVVLEVGRWGIPAVVTVADVRDAMNAGRWRVLDGRLPSTSTEVALSRDDANRLQARLGDTVTATTTSGAERVARLRLVGIVAPYSPWLSGDTGVVLPGTLPADGAEGTTPVPDGSGPGVGPEPSTEYLARTSRPLTWADVRRLNGIGAIVASRSVLEAPPSFCPVDVVCLDSGPAPQPEAAPEHVSDTALADEARYAALAVVVLVLIVLQVALLAGPAFAVQLRRRQRELGLVGASGGTSADLRRAVLASGLVLGIAGGALGMVVGWSSVLLLGGVLPWAPLADNGVPLGVPPLPWYVIGVAAIGVIAAVVASLVPAVLAGRGDVVDALRGRRPLPALRARTPVVGLVLGLAGIGVLAYGRAKVDGLVLGVGIIVGELGLVLVMPWLVVQTGRIGRWLPLAPRLAMRDSGRHRLRTAAAACAIAAAAAAAVATSTAAASTSYITSSTDVPYPVGTLALQTYADGSSAATSPARNLTSRATDVIESVAPASPTAILLAVMPKGAPPVPAGFGPSGTVGCLTHALTAPASTTPGVVVPAVGAPDALGADGSDWVTCGGRTASNGSLGGQVMLLTDPTDLALLLGPLADISAAQAELENGGAVVLQPGSLDDRGNVVLQPDVTQDDGSMSQGVPFRVPAVEVLAGALPVSVILGPKALEPGGAAATLRADDTNEVVVARPSVADEPGQPTVVDQVSVGAMKARLNAVVVPGGSTVPDDTVVQLAVIGAATLVLALLAGLMVTALALADGRSDITTLAAVGAEPRVRRRIAASSAGFVAALGCSAGVVSGLVLAWLLNPLLNRSGSPVVVIQWWLVAFVLVGIPLVTAGVAWLTTRSRIVLTRRRD